MRQHPLSLLLVLAALLTLPNLGTAQMAEELVDTLSPKKQRALLAAEIERIDALTAFGPHRKNRLSAGRLSTINKDNLLKPVPAPRVQLSGPAYKSRMPAAETTTVIKREAKPKLYGPRYKNRRAKTGN